jgi:plasmid stability protein
MAQQTLTLNIPDDLFQRLKQQAKQTGRTIEEEAKNVLATGVPADERMTPELEQMLAGMTLLDDESLWRAARNDLAREAAEEIRRLRAKRARKGLSDAEKQRLADLLYQYDKGILIRAEAAALLKARGHDVNVLLQRP